MVLSRAESSVGSCAQGVWSMEAEGGGGGREELRRREDIDRYALSDIGWRETR